MFRAVDKALMFLGVWAYAISYHPVSASMYLSYCFNYIWWYVDVVCRDLAEL